MSSAALDDAPGRGLRYVLVVVGLPAYDRAQADHRVEPPRRRHLLGDERQLEGPGNPGHRNVRVVHAALGQRRFGAGQQPGRDERIEAGDYYADPQTVSVERALDRLGHSGAPVSAALRRCPILVRFVSR